LSPTQLDFSGGSPQGVSRITGFTPNFDERVLGIGIQGDPPNPPFSGTFLDPTAAATFAAQQRLGAAPLLSPGVGTGIGTQIRGGAGAPTPGVGAVGAGDPVTQALLAAGGGTQAIGTTGLDSLFGNNTSVGATTNPLGQQALGSASSLGGNDVMMQLINRQQAQINQLTQGMTQMSQGLNLIMNRLGIR
jgi:hypothetical protein